MQTFLTIIVWLIFGLLSANYARYRGRDPYLWFFLGMFMGIFAILVLFILPAAEATVEEEGEDPAFAPTSVSQPVTPHELETNDWYYLDRDGLQQGPVTFEVLKQLWHEGGIHPTPYFWSEGMEQWQKLEDIPNLRELLEG